MQGCVFQEVIISSLRELLCKQPVWAEGYSVSFGHCSLGRRRARRHQHSEPQTVACQNNDSLRWAKGVYVDMCQHLPCMCKYLSVCWQSHQLLHFQTVCRFVALPPEHDRAFSSPCFAWACSMPTSGSARQNNTQHDITSMIWSLMNLVKGLICSLATMNYLEMYCSTLYQPE